MSSSPTTCCGPASCWSRRAPASTWAPTTTSGWSPCRRWRSWPTPSTGSATTWPPSGAEAPGSDPGGLAHPGAVHGAGAVGSVALLLLGALRGGSCPGHPLAGDAHHRSEEHTSELQSRGHLVCRLLLEKKKTTSIEQ